MSEQRKATYSVPEFAALMGHSKSSYYEAIHAAQVRGEQPVLFGVPVLCGPGQFVVSRARVDALLEKPAVSTPRRFR